MQFSIFLLVPYISNGNKIINIMKCSQKKYTDNLYYEYYVGKYFINKYIKIFPNFLETYNCFMLKNKDMLLENISKLSYKLSDNLELFDNSSINKWRDSCVNSDLICILIEYVNNPKKLLSIFKSYVNESKTVPNARNKMNDICVLSSILYQTYFVLSNLGNKYTHYDFHIENILLDVPYEKREYMLLNYNLLDGKK